MRRRWSTAVAVLAALLILALTASQSEHERASDRASVPDESIGGAHMRSRALPLPDEEAAAPVPARGTVVDGARNRPIAGATVTSFEPAGTTETTSDGTFALPCTPGRRIRVQARGYIGASPLFVCDGKNRIALLPAVVVEGRVENDSGPLAAASVSCAEGKELAYVSDRATSGEDGTFTLGGCRSGELSVRAMAAGHASAFLELGAREPGDLVRGIVLTLPAGRVAAGIVRDASGAPVRAEILLVEANDWRRVATRPTDDDGRFSIRIGTEAQQVGAVVKDGRSAFVSIPAGAGPLPPLELVLPRPMRLVGTVAGLREEERDGMTVRIFPDRREAQPDNQILRDKFWSANGRGMFFLDTTVQGSTFVFESIEDGPYALNAEGPFGRGEARVDTRETREVTTALRQTANLSVRVKRGAEPAVGTVRVSTPSLSKAYVLKDGRASLGAMEVGEVRMDLQPSDGRPVPEPTSVRLVAGPNDVAWEFSSAFHRTNGIVRDAERRPMKGVQVSLATDAGGWIYGTSPFAVTDESGAYSLDVPGPDSLLFFQRGGFVSTAVRARDAALVDLVPGVTADGIRKP